MTRLDHIFASMSRAHAWFYVRWSQRRQASIKRRGYRMTRQVWQLRGVNWN